MTPNQPTQKTTTTKPPVLYVKRIMVATVDLPDPLGPSIATTIPMVPSIRVRFPVMNWAKRPILRCDTADQPP